MLICEPDGDCSGPSQSLGADLSWGGGAPLYIDGPLNIAAGPGLGTQINPDAPKYGGRLLFSGHIGQVDVTWYSDNHGLNWTLSSTMFGNLTAWGCYRVPGCFDEPFPLSMPDGRVQINMRNDSLTADPYDPARYVGVAHHPRAVAFSTDGGATFGPWSAQLDQVEPAGGCQASALVVTEIEARAPAGTGSIVLFSNPAGYCLNRTKLTVRRSVDGGLRYTQSLQIMAGVGGYSCLAHLPSGSGVGIAFERGIPGDAVCSGGGCAISFEPLPAGFVANGTGSSTVGGNNGAFNPSNDCGPA